VVACVSYDEENEGKNKLLGCVGFDELLS
jgi:hypothetical protein